MSLNITVIIIAQIFGIISWLLLIYSYTQEDIKDLLYFQILVSVFDLIAYFLLGADAGALIVFLELIKTILYYKSDKDRLIFRISIVSYCLIGLLTFKNWYAILAVVGSIVDSFGMSKNSKIANICSIISNTLWAIYDVLILSYVGAISDVVVVICNIGILFAGYSRLMHIAKSKIVKANYLSKETIENIYWLDYRTLGKENTWNKDYQLDVYKKNTDSLYVIKYHNSFVGYINYLNIDEEAYQNLKKIDVMPDNWDLDTIIEFKSNRKSYLVIESINIKRIYEKDEMIKLIIKKMKQFIKSKRKKRVFIHGVLGYAINDFQKDLYEKMKFKRIKILEDNIYLYEFPFNDIKKLL